MNHPGLSNQKYKLEHVWVDLRQGIEIVYSRREHITKVLYMDLYTRVYDYCMSVQHSYSAAEYGWRELYQLLRDFLCNYLVNELNHLSKINKDLLKFISKRWEDYQFSSKILNSVCAYFNRCWVTVEWRKGRKDINKVYQLALITWQDHLFKLLTGPFTDTVSKFLKRQLIGETINTNLISDFLNHFNEIYKNEHFLVNPNNFEARNSNGFGESMTLFEDHIVAQGNTAIEKCGETAITDPNVFVGTILAVHKKYKALVLTAFNNDNGFMSAFDKACSKFINNNSVTRSAGSSSKSPELLAKLCHHLLKKSSDKPKEAELEDILNQVIVVFNYIEDKDAFEKFYSKMLAKRLILCMSASYDAEALMISKLKQACGFQYYFKLHRMFQDIVVSKDLNEQFKNDLANAGGCQLNIDFSIRVLSSGFWPFRQSMFYFTLPTELEQSVHRFTTFYCHRHSGRKLNWLYNLSKGELLTNSFKNRYTLQASTFQMAVLLLFNLNEIWTVQQIEESTGIKKDFLLQVLQILLKSKLLYSNDEEEIHCNSVIYLNTGYQNKKLTVDIDIPIKAELKSEQETTYKNIEDDRKFSIQAAIMRIMKMHRVLKHQQLVDEVMKQLSSRFKPHIYIIEKCINILTEKQYLEKTEEERDAYSYIA